MVPHIVALVTDNLLVRLLDERDPIQGNPFGKRQAHEYLARRETGMRLLSDLLDVEVCTEVVDDLVNFSASLIQMWADESRRDPFALIQEVALRRTSGD
jgi:hypothetical protein